MGRKPKLIQPVKATMEEVVDAIFSKQKAIIKARKVKNKLKDNQKLKVNDNK